MKRINIKPALFILAAFYMLTIVSCTREEAKVESRVMLLSSGWKMEPADKLTGIGDPSVSGEDLNTASWFIKSRLNL